MTGQDTVDPDDLVDKQGVPISDKDLSWKPEEPSDNGVPT